MGTFLTFKVLMPFAMNIRCRGSWPHRGALSWPLPGPKDRVAATWRSWSCQARVRPNNKAGCGLEPVAVLFQARLAVIGLLMCNQHTSQTSEVYTPLVGCASAALLNG